ncbi:ATP-binding protein [Stenotrophomonas sp. PS02289]|uniref:ATP-binding protein n=1 Tax=Stenotrophomonas sp. PS02289 TaxID=2991422 RepID=UPI00249C5305|nr:ATP-binding protein [Stenotrophomonas sp. PS02289]
MSARPGTCAAALSLTLIGLLASQAAVADAPRLIRVAADPSQYRLLTPETRAARDANLVSGYAELVSEQTGMTFREQRVESSRAALRALCDGQADLILLLGTLDGAPCNTLVASPAYYRGQALLATRHTLPNPPELDHLRRVAVIEGSRYAEWLATYHPHLQVVALPTLREALAAVETGVADVALELDVAMRPIVRRDHADSLLLHGAPANLPVSLHLVVRQQDRAVLEQIHQAMRSISPQEHALLMQRWTRATYFSGPSLAVLSQHFRWEMATMGLTVLLLLATGLWLRHTQRAARRNERQQAHFIAMMSHEVRNAAQALVTSVDLLHRSGLDQGQQQLVNAARVAGTGLRQLLGHALDYSRLAAGEYQPRPTWQDMRQLALESTASLRPSAEDKGLTLVLHQLTDPLPRMWLDGDALRQVLNNLLGNALKFTDHGRIEILLELQLEPESATLLLAVHDTGIGIAEDQHETVFQPFAQAHDPDIRRVGGSGLGLSICTDLVKALGGELRLYSAPDKGSTFEIRLPVAVEGTDAGPADQPLAGRSLLLIEDHALNRTVVGRQLAALGASVSTCADGASALRSQANEPCGLVVLDCVMGDISGYDLARLLRRQEQQLQRQPAVLIALSANDGPAHVQRCRDCGMDGVLCKPLDTQELLAVIGVRRTDPAGAGMPSAPNDDPMWLHYLRAVAEEHEIIKDALRAHDDKRLRHHAHRLAGVLRMVGQPSLAGIASDLHELDLDEPADWLEVERLLGYLRPALALLTRGCPTSAGAGSAATVHAPETPSVRDPWP